MGITFDVSAVEPGASRYALLSPEEAFQSIVEQDRRASAVKPGEGRVPLRRLHACRAESPVLQPTALHPLFYAIVTAFNEHLPLILSPDHVWALILQGVGRHLARDTEALWDAWDPSAGRVSLQVRRDDLVWGAPDNPWEEVFGAFCKKIQGHVGPLAGALTAPLSTTEPLTQAVHHLLLMDSLKHHFHYEFQVLCGIPAISLEGTAQDWRALLARTALLDELGLSWWTERLQPVLEQLVRAAEGTPDLDFWRSFVNHESMSGSSSYSGWMVHLLPYTASGARNPLLDLTPAQMGTQTLTEAEFRARHGAPSRTLLEPIQVVYALEASDIPGGLHRIPFQARVGAQRRSADWVGGFVGCAQELLYGGLRPALGWAVLGD